MNFGKTGGVLRTLLAAIGCFLLISVQSHAAETFNRLLPDVPPGYKPLESSNAESGIWMSLENIERDFKTSPNRIKDEAINTYVKGILCKLAPDYCNDIRLYIMRVPHFNAAMYPNGMMVVWSGLLLRVRNEAQLAAVLGHELGHYLKRHTMKQYESIKSSAAIGTILTIGLGGIGTLSQIVMMAGNLAHSRDSEREADQYGIQMIADAGYDPYQVPVVWRNIQEEEASTGKKKGNVPFLATHPSPKDREKTLTGLADSLTSGVTSGEAGTENYQRELQVHLALLLEDELNLNQHLRTRYLLDSLSRDCAQVNGCNMGLLYFYHGELFRLKNEEGDRALAVENYHSSIKYADAPAEAFRGLGLIEMKAGNLEIAKEYLRQYLEKSPEAGDREMIEYYLTMEK